jgi:hypothetical protein
MKNINVCLAIFAMSLAAAMSAGASLTISGSQLGGSGVTYNPNGVGGNYSGVNNEADYQSGNGGYAYLVNPESGSGDSAMVTIANGYLGAQLGTLNTLITAGAAGKMSFNFNLNTGAPNGGGTFQALQWVITLSDPNNSANKLTLYSFTDDTSAINYFDYSGQSGGQYLSANNSPINYYSNPNNTSWSTEAATLDNGTTLGNWNVVSVGINVGSINSASATYAEITSITLDPVPEPSTIIWGGLLLLPIGASTLRMLRRRQNQGLGMTA